MSDALTIGSLCSGIGGLDLGLERAGFGPVLWQAERDPWCRRVLARHWPDATQYESVEDVDERAARVGLVCAGFPCQPVSVAGKRKGGADERWLWPEVARIVETLQPAVLVVENVPGLRTLGLRSVLADLARLGFDAEWSHLAAGEIGAPHLRRRLFLAATHPDRLELRDEPGWLARAFDRAAASVAGVDAALCVPPDADPMWRLESARRVAIQRGWARNCGWELGAAAGMDDGPTARLDVGRRRRACGNAVVPQAAEVLGHAIMSGVAP